MAENLLDEPRTGAAPSWRGRPDELFPRWLKVAAVVAILVGSAGGLVHVPYHSISPGSTLDVLGEIEVRGQPTYPSEGQLLLTTVSVSNATLTAWEVVRVWLDPDVAAIHREYLYPSNVEPSDIDLENKIAIRESKVVGTAAAFRALGRKVRANGATVFETLPEMPARGVLREGDRIVAIDGALLRTKADVISGIERVRPDLIDDLRRADPGRERKAIRRQMRRRRPGDPIHVTVVRAGNRVTFDLRMGRDADGRARLGVLLLSSFNLPSVRINSRRIVGPSAGLVFALTVVDSFTEDDLTGGRIIGVTGAIDEDGTVGEIGGAFHKVRGAAAAGATVFLVPKPEEAEAIAAAPDGMMVIGVTTLTEAIEILRDLPSIGGELAAED